MKLWSILGVLSAFLFSLASFAQDAMMASGQDDLAAVGEIFRILSSVENASAGVLVIALVQCCMVIFRRTNWADKAVGAWKVVIMAVLTFIGAAADAYTKDKLGWDILKDGSLLTVIQFLFHHFVINKAKERARAQSQDNQPKP